MVMLRDEEERYKRVACTRSFKMLSEEAQNLIVGVIMGEFESGPPEVNESVKTEITAWVLSDDLNK